MILIDANLLVYAHVASMPRHQAAISWLDQKLNGTAIVALPWQSLLSFARIGHQSTALRKTVIRCHGVGANRKLAELPGGPDSQSRRPVQGNSRPIDGEFGGPVESHS